MRFVLVGGSVSRSRSPEIHHTMMRLTNIEGEYSTRDCDASDVETIIEQLRNREVDGINVTMPHKERAADLADRLEGHASASRSVNTLRISEGAVAGASTDSMAFAELFAAFPRVSSVLVLGTGGAARSALAAKPPIPTYLAGRSPEAVERLAGQFGVQGIGWGTGVAGSLLVNATPIGAKGEEIPGDVLTAAGGLIDLPYVGVNEGRTPAIDHCVEAGISHVDGFDFLVRQAVHSFNLWTGTDLEFKTVRDSL